MDKVNHYVELFDQLDQNMVYDFLLELGSQGQFPTELMTNSNFVNGCQSQVWIYPYIEEDNNKIKFLGHSDSFMVRGVIYLIIDIVSDMEDPTQVTWRDIEPLAKYFSMQRRRGMQAIINKIRSVVR